MLLLYRVIYLQSTNKKENNKGQAKMNDTYRISVAWHFMKNKYDKVKAIK